MLTLLLCQALRLYFWVLFARIIVSFIPAFRPGWRPAPWLQPILDAVYGLTEPPLRALRKVIPQPAGMPLDLSFLVLAILVGTILPRILC